MIYFILRRFQKILEKSKSQPMLGRWKITYEPKTIQSKVDWANVDHCGCCN